MSALIVAVTIATLIIKNHAPKYRQGMTLDFMKQTTVTIGRANKKEALLDRVVLKLCKVWIYYSCLYFLLISYSY